MVYPFNETETIVSTKKNKGVPYILQCNYLYDVWCECYTMLHYVTTDFLKRLNTT